MHIREWIISFGEYLLKIATQMSRFGVMCFSVDDDHLLRTYEPLEVKATVSLGQTSRGRGVSQRVEHIYIVCVGAGDPYQITN